MHQPIEPPIIYLNVDGVLHPDAAHRTRGKNVVPGEGALLFQWAAVRNWFPRIRRRELVIQSRMHCCSGGSRSRRNE